MSKEQDVVEIARKKLSELAHDVRHPLATFQSFLHILEMQEYNMNSNDLKELAQEVEASLQKSLENIDLHIKSLMAEWKDH